MSYDVFLSYRRTDLSRALPLLEALETAGLRVWRDTTNLPDNAPITPEIRGGLASSKVLVALYSADYALSRPCQEEITTAWLAAQQLGEQPYDRVLVINPESTFDHLPKILCEQQSMGFAKDAAGCRTVASKISRHVTGLGTTLAPAQAPAMPTYHGMVPVGAPRFVGRLREMWELHGQLTANRMSIITGVCGLATTQVRGLGGNGKSLLAREYAIRFGAAYAGGVFWLGAYGNDDSKGPLDVEAREALRLGQVRDFAVRIGAQVQGLTPEQVETAFWRKIEGNGQPCLWIVDDLPSELELKEIELRWNAQWGGASTLITTRSSDYGTLGGHLDLDVLTEAESRQLLIGHRIPEGKAEEEAAGRIVAELGNHPLAIEVAGSFLAKGTQSFRQYLDGLGKPEQDAVELGAELRESLPTGHERSITGTLLKSIRLLGEEGMDFLCLASNLAVDTIPVKLVVAAFEFLDSQAPDGGRVVRAVDQADSLGLSRKVGDDGRSVHTLVSRTIRYRFRKHGRVELLRTAAVQTLCSLLRVVIDIRRHEEVTLEVIHARHLISGGISDVEEAVLASRLGIHDYERGDYRGARKLQEQVLEACGRLLGAEHPDTLTATSILAQTVNAQGDLAGARKLQEQVLEVRRRLLNAEHPDTLMAMANLAGTLYEQGELPEALELQGQVAEASRRVLGDEHLDTVSAMANLAQMLQAQGDLATARKVKERVLEVQRRLLGAEHSDTLKTMGNLAQLLQAQGDLAAARKLQEEVLEACRKLLGAEHPHTLTMMANLAGNLLMQNELADARDLYEHVLNARRRLMGAEHPDTLTVMANLAGTLFQQRDLAGARKLQEQVLEASRRILLAEHPNTLKVMAQLAQTLQAQGDPSGAWKLNEEVLETSRRRLGAEHPDTLQIMGNMAQLLRALGDLAGVRKLQEHVLDATWRVLGPEHPNTLAAVLNLAETLDAQGDLAGARKLHKLVLQAQGQLLGSENTEAVETLASLAGMLEKQVELAQLQSALLGAKQPETLIGTQNLPVTFLAKVRHKFASLRVFRRSDKE